MNTQPAGQGQSELLFTNRSERRLTLEDVFQRISAFMQTEPRGTYRFIVGTDCQVHSRSTTFVTGIVIHRLGYGAWACHRKSVVPLRIYSIGQKLSMETSLSQEVLSEFGTGRLQQLEDIVLPYLYQGASFQSFVDIDAGVDELRNKTAPFVTEMVNRIEAMGIQARIKPEAVIASSYANRFTKKGTKAWKQGR